MTHKAGIDAAIDVYDLTFSYSFPDCDYRSIVEGIVKAYLSSSGMVLVPREATAEMVKAGFGSRWRLDTKLGSQAASELYEDMISSAPDPFNRK